MKLRIIENNKYEGLDLVDEFGSDSDSCPLCGMNISPDYGFLFTRCHNCNSGYCPNCKPGGKNWKHEGTPEQMARRKETLAKFVTKVKRISGYGKEMIQILKCPNCN